MAGKSTYFIYIDDTGDHAIYGYSALCIPVEGYKDLLGCVKQFRRQLRDSDGIYINKEFHAVDFCAGRGRIAPGIVTKRRRGEIFNLTLSWIATLPGVRLFNAFGARDTKLRTLERLINRINRSLEEWGGRGILVFDEGEELAYRKLVRKMGVFNPIPSARGGWPDGSQYRNLPIERVIEDPFFKMSRQSYFIQLADFCGYAMLQRERPTTSEKKARLRLHESFPLLEQICVKEANRRDPFGIIRA